MNSRAADHAIAVGILFATLTVYVATSPGRIDIVDGQSRYDVAYHWVVEGRPVLRDPIIGSFMAVPGRDGLPYGYYGAAGSLFSAPLITLGLLLGDPSGEAARFLFSLTSSIFGALTATVLFLFYRDLGVPARSAVLWTIVAAFTTLLWPGAVSTFDNAQHAFFVLTAVYLGHLSAARRSLRLAATAGLVAGVLLLYQEYFALVIPALGAATLDFSSHQGRIRLASPKESSLRFLAFGAASVVGLILALAYNEVRFGSWFETGKLYFAAEGTVLGNPIAGLLTLVISPGKSVFLYSPPLVLGLLGFSRLWRQRTALATVLVAASLIVLLLFSAFRFAGGDWCWGPRYLLVLLPLWALPLPFVPLHTRLRKSLIAIAGAGLVVQVLAVSVEHQRFFFARGLNDLFWSEDPWVYFKQSALFARPGEFVSLKDGPPPTARWFNSIHQPGWSTYAILGPPLNMPRKLAPEWMRQYQIYYLPRPWPLWMWSVDPELRPVNIPLWLAGLLVTGAVGLTQIRGGLRQGLDAGDCSGR